MSRPTFLDPLIGNGAGACELIDARRGSVLASHVEPAFDSKTRKKGLLGRESIPDGYALVIAPCSSIHTFFMRCPIDAVFVSRNGTVTKACRGVRPWRLAGSMGAFAVVEAAQGFIGRHDIVPGDIVALRELAPGRGAANGQPVGAQAPAAKVAETAAQPGAAHRPMTLADVVASRTALAWFEAVAVVQELCEAVEARGPAREPRVPELKDIGLTAEGKVTLLAGGPAAHPPVHRAALVLLALTPEEQLPVQLRLLILKEASAKPQFHGLPELRRELEFFERPDRRKIVADVYKRLERSPDSGLSTPLAPPLVLEPPPERRRPRWSRRRAAVWLLIVLLAFAAAGASWAWRRPLGRDVRSTAAQMTSAAAGLARSGFEAARRRAGDLGRRLGLVSQVRQSAGSPPSEPEHRGAVPPEPPASRPAAVLQMPPGTLLPTEAAPSPAPQAPRSPAAAASVASGSAVLEGSRPGGAGGAQPAAPVVYSSADVDVVPPRVVKPAWPGRLAAAEGPKEPVEIEVVVSATGEVEAVKLLSGGSGTLTAMTLSAVKTWSFEPATRGGEPVAYRQRMKLPQR
jgi:hypothetical protein